jgi:hypothetical protein
VGRGVCLWYYTLVLGPEQVTNPAPVVRDVIANEEGMAAFDLDFPTECQAMMIALLGGLKAAARNKGDKRWNMLHLSVPARPIPTLTRHGLQDVRLFRNAMDPVQVADLGDRGMMRRQRVVVAGFGNRLQVLLFRFFASFMTTGILHRRWVALLAKTGV